MSYFVLPHFNSKYFSDDGKSIILRKFYALNINSIALFVSQIFVYWAWYQNLKLKKEHLTHQKRALVERPSETLWWTRPRHVYSNRTPRRIADFGENTLISAPNLSIVPKLLLSLVLDNQKHVVGEITSNTQVRLWNTDRSRWKTVIRNRCRAEQRYLPRRLVSLECQVADIVV